MTQFTVLGIPQGDLKILDSKIDVITTSKSGDDDIYDMAKYVGIQENYKELGTCGVFIIIHETEHVIWQLLYYDDPKQQKDENINHIASLLNPKKNTIYGKVVIFCSKVVEDFTCVPLSASISNLKEIINSRSEYSGCLVSSNGEIKEIKINDIKELESLIKKTKINSRTCKLFGSSGFFLELYYSEEYKILNKFATTISSDQLIHGMVFILLKYNEYCYETLDKNLLLRFYNLCTLPLHYRDSLSEDDMKSEKNMYGLPLVKNKWFILKNKELELKNKLNLCWTCEKRSKLKLCTGCYRLRYCSRKCQIDDYPEHKEDCKKR